MIVRRSLAKEEFDESTAVDIELEPGQMVMFDVYTIHGAAHNRGTIPRAGLCPALHAVDQPFRP